MSTIVNLLAAVAVLIFAWLWLVERTHRMHQTAVERNARTEQATAYEVRLRASHATNDYLAAEVSRREAAIGRLLVQQNAATVAKVAASQRNIGACFALGLPVHRVDLRQINWN